MAVLWTFREPSLGRLVPHELMRSAVLNLTLIIPATACHQRNYVERYSRFIRSCGGQRRGVAHGYFDMRRAGLCYDTQPVEAMPFPIDIPDKPPRALSEDFYQEKLPSKPLAERFSRKICLL